MTFDGEEFCLRLRRQNGSALPNELMRSDGQAVPLDQILAPLLPLKATDFDKVCNGLVELRAEAGGWQIYAFMSGKGVRRKRERFEAIRRWLEGLL